MAPRKKPSNMVWVVKSKQPAKTTTEPATEKKTSPVLSDSSLLSDSVSKLHLSSKDHTSSPDWSNLPEELLHIISSKLEDRFDFIHARSVCRPWRSIFPYPSSSLRTTYSLPSFDKFPRIGRGGSCTLERFPVYLFRLHSPDTSSPSQFFVGGIGPNKSPIQGSDPNLINIADCQIIPLGYMCRMVGYDPDSLATSYRGVAFLELNDETGEFIVLVGYAHCILALRSADMSWTQVDNASRADCSDIVTFRGKFYAVFINGDVFAIDPYTLETTPLRPPNIPGCGRQNYLVPHGDDELYLVERIIVRNGVLSFTKMACRVSVLDEEAGEWVVVSDLGDRVLLIGQPGNSSGNTSCSAKELPDGCGVSGSSMLFINEIFDETFPYKYGVDTGNPGDDLNVWRCSRETRVTILNKSPMVSLRIERAET